MGYSTTTRRRFLIAAIALSGTAGGIRVSRVWAQPTADLDDASLRTIADMVRRLFPHASISDEVYAQVIDSALSAAAGDNSLASALGEAEAAVNAVQATDFIDLDPDAQIRALQTIEETPFFAAIHSAVLVGVYNHPTIWELVGYGGPSFAHGGYLNRGAGEVDWLQEAD